MFSEGKIVIENGTIKSVPYPQDLPSKLGWSKEKHNKLDKEFAKEKEKLKLKLMKK
jgi:hypothetical protein